MKQLHDVARLDNLVCILQRVVVHGHRERRLRHRQVDLVLANIRAARVPETSTQVSCKFSLHVISPPPPKHTPALGQLEGARMEILAGRLDALEHNLVVHADVVTLGAHLVARHDAEPALAPVVGVEVDLHVAGWRQERAGVRWGEVSRTM